MPNNRRTKKKNNFKGGDISNLSDKIGRREADLGFFNEQRGLANTDQRRVIDRQIESMEGKLKPMKKYKNRKQDIDMFRGMLQDVPTNMKQDIQTKVRALEQENLILEAEIMGRPLPAPLNQPPGMLPSAHPQPPIAEMRRNVTVLLTDLDETLLTSTDPDLRSHLCRNNLKLIGQFNRAVPGAVPDLVDVITNDDIVNFLHMVSLDDNILWFIVSAGNNVEKLQSLLKYGNDTGRPLQYDNPGTEFGLKDKKVSVQMILEAVGQNNNIENVLFIDDTDKNLRAVAELGVNVLPVEENVYQMDWWSPQMMTPNNVAQARQILGF